MADCTELDLAATGAEGNKRASDAENSIFDDSKAKKPHTEDAAIDGEEAAPSQEQNKEEAPADDEALEADAAEAENHENTEASVGAVNGTSQEEKPAEAKVGPKVFTSGKQMYTFFYELVHAWPLSCNLNKYEHLILEDLIVKGHQDPKTKIGAGIEAFQVRVNPDFNSRCYYVVRKDGSVDDFSYRKCVNNIMPLPEDFVVHQGHGNRGNKNHHKGGRGFQNNRGRGGNFGGRGRGGRRRF